MSLEEINSAKFRAEMRELGLRLDYALEHGTDQEVFKEMIDRASAELAKHAISVAGELGSTFAGGNNEGLRRVSEDVARRTALSCSTEFLKRVIQESVSR
jgi:hypothetical protein